MIETLATGVLSLEPTPESVLAKMAKQKARKRTEAVGEEEEMESYGLLETKVKESVETATMQSAGAKVKKVAVKKKGSLHADRMRSV